MQSVHEYTIEFRTQLGISIKDPQILMYIGGFNTNLQKFIMLFNCTKFYHIFMQYQYLEEDGKKKIVF